MSSPSAVKSISVKREDLHGPDANELVLSSASFNGSRVGTTVLENSQQTFSDDDKCNVMLFDEHQNVNMKDHNALRSLVIKKCAQCKMETETNEFCYNLLESKQLKVADVGHPDNERTQNSKGPLRYFGRTLRNCANCDNLEIHNLFSRSDEDLLLKLNLGGFSPVVFNNIFKTCESKGSDFECRLVILGARPRSSPAYAILNDQASPRSKEFHPNSSKSIEKHQRDLPSAVTRPSNYYSSIYEFPNTTQALQAHQQVTQATYGSSAHTLSGPESTGSLSSNKGIFSADIYSKDFNTHVAKSVVSSYSAGSHQVSFWNRLNKPISTENDFEGNKKIENIKVEVGKEENYQERNFLIPKSNSPSHETNRHDCERTKYHPVSSCKDIELKMGDSLITASNSQQIPGFNIQISAAMHDGSFTNTESETMSSFVRDDVRKDDKQIFNLSGNNSVFLPAKRRSADMQNSTAMKEKNISNTPKRQYVLLDYESETPIIQGATSLSAGKTPVPEETMIETLTHVSQEMEALLAVPGVTDQRKDAKVVIDIASNESESRSRSPRTSPALLLKNQDNEQVGSENRSEIMSDSSTTLKERLAVSDWTNDDVISFLNGTDCAEYADVFQQEEIDGQSLLLLTEEKLHKLLGIKMGPAMKIARHIRNLQQYFPCESESTTDK